MLTVNSAILAEMRGRELMPFLLLSMTLDSVNYAYTSAPMPIALGGTLYQPRHLELGQVRRGAGVVVESAQITLLNLDRVLMTAFVGGAPQGSPASLSEVYLDRASRAPLGNAAVTLLAGEVGRWSLAEDVLTFTLRNSYATWSNITFNSHSPSCRWRTFKGAECGYTGTAVECDRSYARCVALGNSANFGGYRYLPDIENKAIWWGQAPRDGK